MKRYTLAVLVGLAGMSLMSSASAADLIIEEAPVVGIVDVSSDWEGPYIGGFVGWASGTADMTDPLAGPCSAGDLEGCDVDISGWLVGLKGGVNFAVADGVIAGIVGDIAWADISGTDTFPAPVDESTNSINWQGSVRGLLGFDGGAFMPYVTAGLAVANASHYSDFADPFIDTVDATHIGWTAGVGVDFAVTEDLAVNLEYRYSDYGSQEYDHETPVDPPEFGLTTHQVTVGLNWQF